MRTRVLAVGAWFLVACGSSGGGSPDAAIDGNVGDPVDASIDAPACTTGADCDDGDPCNGQESCNGDCVAGTPPTCDDGNACTNDSCIAGVGCATTIAPCDDGNACTADSCHPTSGCVATPLTGQSCADADLCDGQEFCDSTGSCVAGVALTCDDGNFCTIDSCLPATGCTVTPDVGAACSDGDACNGLETCDTAGACAAGTALDCNDGQGCTVDTCDPAAGCANTPTPGASCSDADACNGFETCTAAGTCGPGDPLDCNDGIACTLDSCAPWGCVNDPITTPIAGDGCCPAGATSLTDNDCSASCGNGAVEPLAGETCDTVIAIGSPGACPTSCNDGNGCTDDVLICSSSGGCCSGVCATGNCSFLTTCRADGDLCNTDADCCNDSCVAGRCTILGACLTVGNPCSGFGSCCSNACVDSGLGTGQCRYLCGCRPLNEVCDAPGDCCSGSCVPDSSGVPRCDKDTPCLEDGEVCGGSGASQNCCSGGKFGCLNTIAGIRRCIGTAACKLVGEPCGACDQCCSQVCVQDANSVFRCANACIPEGGGCSTDSDCCNNGACLPSVPT